MKHSSIVGGSTAKRVINCPASVKLCAAMPPQPSSSYADEGTLLHNIIASVLGEDASLDQLIGVAKYEGIVLTQDHIDDKIKPALALLDEVDPNHTMMYEVEQKVSFRDYLPGVFGSADLIGRIGNRAIVLDWKFGDGVIVEAEENAQGLFYAAAAMRTPETQWAFVGVEEIEIVIVQPPSIKRWVTTPARVKDFESTLKSAVALADTAHAPMLVGDHCRWCAAKPTCPKFTGAVDRALQAKIATLDTEMIGMYLKNAEMLEQWIADLRALAFAMMEKSVPVPGWKLVAKRATRSWADEAKAKAELLAVLPESAVMVSKLVSPAQAEKLLKKQPIPETVSISSGSTLAPESDPRPGVLQIGKQLTAALSKLQ